MQAFIAVTDGNWVRHLSALPELAEVNFWQPSPHGFKALQPGEPLLFKLHHPENFIVGGGFFAHYTALPCGTVWEAFGPRNGSASLDEMLARITRYRHAPATEATTIGCILLEQPFFFPRELWIPAPSDFAKNIVTGKTYNFKERTELWEAVQFRLLTQDLDLAEPEDSGEMFTEAWVRRRLGQGSFRALVTDAYERRCAVTGEKILPVLQAAHIRPVTEGGLHRVDNGLLLRSDVHTLFDKGYLTVTPTFQLAVSKRLRDDFDNGAYYYDMRGREIRLPQPQQDRPNLELLEWHADSVFLR
jgi:putative restriction endonuclease